VAFVPGHHVSAQTVRCAQALSMPEDRAERAVEAPAKSIDGAERSSMMKDVMAVAQIDTQDRPHVLGHGVARSWS
jgi:hypothetical protein